MFTIPQFFLKIECATYNHAPYITETMNGFCMQQTCFPYVCVIMDDASTDGEQQIIDNYLHVFFELEESFNGEKETDDYILKIARHKTNINCFFAVYYLKYNHYSIKKDKRLYDLKIFDDVKYIATCEGDDYWTDPLKLQKQVDFLENHPDYVLCSHETKRYNQNTGVMNYTKHKILDIFPDGFSFDKKYMGWNYGGWFTQTLTNVYRADFDGKDIYMSMQTKLDVIFSYFMKKAGKCFLMPDVMSVYRIHSGGICSGSTFVPFYRMVLDSFKELNEKDNSADAREVLRRQVMINFANLIFNKAWSEIIYSLRLVYEYTTFYENIVFLIKVTMYTIYSIIKSLSDIIGIKWSIYRKRIISGNYKNIGV